jgi:hypothetical protein
MAVTLGNFRQLSQPEQVRVLAAHGQLLATRREDGLWQELHDLRGFFVETWSWADDGSIGLLFSFQETNQLDRWLEGLVVGLDPSL